MTKRTKAPYLDRLGRVGGLLLRLTESLHDDMLTRRGLQDLTLRALNHLKGQAQ